MANIRPQIFLTDWEIHPEFDEQRIMSLYSGEPVEIIQGPVRYVITQSYLITGMEGQPDPSRNYMAEALEMEGITPQIVNGMIRNNVTEAKKVVKKRAAKKKSQEKGYVSPLKRGKKKASRKKTVKEEPSAPNNPYSYLSVEFDD